MKSRQDFNNTASPKMRYEEYCIAYFAGQILAAQNNYHKPTRNEMTEQAEKAVRMADALQKALGAWQIDSETFDY